MSGRLITVLYEDQLAAGPTNYGPHVLVLACAADALGGDRWSLRQRVDGIPKKGDAKLRREIAENAGRLVRQGPLLVLFDSDRIRRCYDLDSAACRRSVLDKIAREAGVPLRAVLLEQNMEDVIAACCQALHRPVPAKKPTPAERDAVLHAAAAADRRVRDEILEAVPSFARLVRLVTHELTS